MATDPDGSTGYGSVAYSYQMGKYDVTIGQYVQFLNAVAQTDTYGLYYSSVFSGTTHYWMAPGTADLTTIGITRTGVSGSYTYSVGGGFSQSANCPIFYESWGDPSGSATGCTMASPPQPKGRARRRPGRTRSTERLR